MLKAQRIFIVLLAFTLIFGIAGCSSTVTEDGPEETAPEEWVPERPINVIITYAAGGGTDRNVRQIIALMEKEMGTNLVAVNMAGATGTIAYDFVYNQERDGYTILGCATNDVMHYRVTDLHKVPTEEWYWWIICQQRTLVTVRQDSPYKTMDELMAAFKANPGKISISSAGVGANAHVAAEKLKKAAGIEYLHVPYEGAYPAIIATLQGEAEVTLHHVDEQLDLLKAGDLRALAVYDTEPYDMEGYGVIPAVTDFIPEMEPLVPHGAHFALGVPKDTPQNIINTIEEAFVKAINSNEFKKFGEDTGAKVLGLCGQEAEDWLAEQAPPTCWILYEAGVGVNDPSQFGMEKPW
jgi:tripartite-type tricarboxylate transporter receptor subunit TctC